MTIHMENISSLSLHEIESVWGFCLETGAKAAGKESLRKSHIENSRVFLEHFTTTIYLSPKRSSGTVMKQEAWQGFLVSCRGQTYETAWGG